MVEAGTGIPGLDFLQPSSTDPDLARERYLRDAMSLARLFDPPPGKLLNEGQ